MSSAPGSVAIFFELQRLYEQYKTEFHAFVSDSPSHVEYLVNEFTEEETQRCLEAIQNGNFGFVAIEFEGGDVLSHKRTPLKTEMLGSDSIVLENLAKFHLDISEMPSVKYFDFLIRISLYSDGSPFVIEGDLVEIDDDSYAKSNEYFIAISAETQPFLLQRRYDQYEDLVMLGTRLEEGPQHKLSDEDCLTILELILSAKPNFRTVIAIHYPI